MAITRHSPCCDPGSIPGIGVIFCLPFFNYIARFFFLNYSKTLSHVNNSLRMLLDMGKWL